MSARILVSVVTCNSAPYIESCLESLRAQTFKDFSVLLWDNASIDATSTILRRWGEELGSVHFSGRNLGFCAAQNRLIASAVSDYSLVLNPDIVLDAHFLEILIREMDRDAGAGSATGKLWRLNAEIPHPGREGASRKILDTTGIYMTPNQRHFDRGSGEIDAGQYEKREYVFGASGAAAVYRRAMLEDVRAGDEYFDESFFAYREDVDLAWRAQWRGWHCLYIPEAKGYHARRVLPERRRALPETINMHSFKNRFLLRIKNMDLGTYLRFLIPITLRDGAAIVYVLAREWSSIPGILLLFRAAPRAWAARRSIKNSRRTSAAEIRSWFSSKPTAKPIMEQTNKTK
jgi:GT2 family glycosyltransferase